MIKIGSSRFVILISNFAIKIPFIPIGLSQNLNEIKLWNKYKNIDSLCPILFHCWIFIVMRRCNYTKSTKQFDDAVLKIKSEITELDFDLCDLWNVENWGIYNDKYYLIDYGINEKIRDYYLKKPLK